MSKKNVYIYLVNLIDQSGSEDEDERNKWFYIVFS